MSRGVHNHVDSVTGKTFECRNDACKMPYKTYIRPSPGDRRRK